jgi:hypothetical protein
VVDRLDGADVMLLCFGSSLAAVMPITQRETPA